MGIRILEYFGACDYCGQKSISVDLVRNNKVEYFVCTCCGSIVPHERVGASRYGDI
jgi:hypothetical protein